MAFSTSQSICVKQVAGKGLGVFAACDIAADELIERCPVLVMTKSDVWQADSLLSRYVFSWGKAKVALALGYGSLYNHSYHQWVCCSPQKAVYVTGKVSVHVFIIFD